MNGTDPVTPWLHDLYGDDLAYQWLQVNRKMRSVEHGIEITYRPRESGDVICGERTVRSGIPSFEKRYPWQTDQSVPHEVTCTVVGDHGEVPHIGVPAECADMTCRCRDYGSYHLVIVGFVIRPEVRSV